VTKIAFRKFASLKSLYVAAVSLTLIAAVLPAAATYGPRVTINGVYQQTSNVTSPNGIDAGNCDNTTFCYILFQPISNQQDVIIEHVSCWGHTNNASANPSRVVFQSRRGTALQFRWTLLVPSKTGSFNFSAGGPVLHPLESTDRPVAYLEIDANAGIVGDCSISGHVVTP